jgi:D-alanyl-D-alanine carboxypeptidase
VTNGPTQFSERIANHLRELGIPADYGPLRGLAEQAEAMHLVAARTLEDGRELKLAPEAAAAWAKMKIDAERDRIQLLLISGFRSYDHQRSIIERKLAAGDALESVLRVNVAPGFSEHHTGRAVDIGTPGCLPLSEDFERTVAFAWLASHAERHGFRLSYPRRNPHGVIYEPWHWLFT